MAYCSKCSAAVNGRFCTVCGKDTASESAIEIPARVETVSVPFADVPRPSMASIADNQFTAVADHLVTGMKEQIAWQGKPSLMILLPRVISWGVIILLAMVIAASLRQGGGKWVLFWMFAAVLHVWAGYLDWRNTTYRVTSQRIEYSGGILSCNTAASPLSQIANVTILRPALWNLMDWGILSLTFPTRPIAARRDVKSS